MCQWCQCVHSEQCSFFLSSIRQIEICLYCQQAGNTALHIACEGGNVNVAEFLLRRGVDPEIKNNVSAVNSKSSIMIVLQFVVRLQEGKTAFECCKVEEHRLRLEAEIQCVLK